MARKVGTTDLRHHLTDLLQAVREERETYVVETFGRPQAALVNLDEYEQFQRFQREQSADHTANKSEAVHESTVFYETEQLFVGKLAGTAEGGQLSVFPLPQDLNWLRHFSAKHLAEFFAELLDTLLHAQLSGDWSSVSEVIESWKATADIEADPALVEMLDEGLLDLEEGRSTSWTTLREELDL
jgi:prevent-host-death family protein